MYDLGKFTRKLTATLVAAVFAIVITGCGEKVSTASEASASSQSSCGTIKVANNPWVGYEANMGVFEYVAKKELGCDVVAKQLYEEVSWQGFQTGDVDIILENWGHEALAKKYINDLKLAVDLGSLGTKGIIGWYIAPWMAEKYPDILDWHNLNKYSDLFKTSESGNKGAFLDGDPSYSSNDEALMKGLKLNFKVVYTGSEDALVTAFRKSQAEKFPVIGYFYAPHWFLSEIPLKQIPLPPYTAGCDSDPNIMACDYPAYDLNKVASKKFMDSNSSAVAFVKNFNWTNADQNEVARSIAVDKLSRADAAKLWIDKHPEVVAKWLGK